VRSRIKSLTPARNRGIGRFTSAELASRVVPAKVLKQFANADDNENHWPVRPKRSEDSENINMSQIVNQKERSDSDQNQWTHQRSVLGLADIHD
jgi:hypothetical protein